MSATLKSLHREITFCRRCPRLVRWRETAAREKIKRFADEDYWGRPVPGFGDPDARVLLVGLAPAAHGANRTGRMFTGDESGRWLYRALYKAGFSNQSSSTHAGDGLALRDCYITASLRCAPPLNKPTRKELAACRPFLTRELGLLSRINVVVCLGRIGFDTSLQVFREAELIAFGKKPTFSHCAVHRFDKLTFVASYHPSQQNTFTGKLTEPMFDKVFWFVKRELARMERKLR